MRIPFAREGYFYITVLTLGTVMLYFAQGFNANNYMGHISLVLALFVINFFRDPERAVPEGEDNLVSPADGVILKVDTVDGKDFYGGLYEGELKRVCVFMNVFNVHVNRNPISGTIKAIDYKHGKFFNANFDKAATDNEQNSILVEREDGKKILFCQIAGLVARRIVSYLEVGDKVKRGERMGIILFGSRVDILMPMDSVVQVEVGQKVSATTTIIAKL